MDFRRLATRATAFALAAVLSTSVAFAAKPAPAGKININTASVEQLSTLPGVGPKLASRIVEQRQKQSFKSVQELMTVQGIGEKSFEKMAPFLSTGGDAASTAAKAPAAPKSSAN